MNKSGFFFFSDLYNKENLTEEGLDKYMKYIPIPKFMKEAKDILSKNISVQEISYALKEFQKGKHPVPDGLTTMYYKYLEEEIMLPLQKKRVKFNK